MIRNLKGYLWTALILLSILVIVGGWWLFSRQDIYPASILVEPGDRFHNVVVKLNERDIVGSPWFFSKAGIIIGLDRHIIPGRYDFEKRISNFEILRKLWRGDIAVLNVTIPEGFILMQIRELLHQKCGANPERFDSLVRDSSYLSALGIDAGFAEGYLFPETYRFQWGITSREAVETMTAYLFQHLDDSLLERGRELGYNLDEILTMASIVESEGSHADEFPLIASVYRNRLNTGMKLQADPTIIYGMGGLDRTLMIKDYQFSSAYNTYLHEGLPPTPICSPGMNAIMAVLYPDSTDYYYFVADGKGRHIFNETYQGHLRDTRRVKNQSR
ncbi:MAG: endolytic transglycosylase MltG [Candidatus Zixiibacteriota bacterium]